MPAITRSRKRAVVRLDVARPLLKPLLEQANALAGIVHDSGGPDMTEGCPKGCYLKNQEDLLAIDMVSLDACLSSMETQIKLIRRYVK